ncbi:hypothetical protein K435DRAFT_800015 [Dendrothele bispora CBS 962.96]|uniref:Uncharacterized protein n=1 Tax=Dendrothele bispora (strain CBS 962.96) TaxID=1314807 RepID=A0A4S8LU05_DENBC|nr:hypothetical protein K435DRAFT_800015 [Dendrothele bispora CBS 962.96]
MIVMVSYDGQEIFTYNDGFGEEIDPDRFTKRHKDGLVGGRMTDNAVDNDHPNPQCPNSTTIACSSGGSSYGSTNIITSYGPSGSGRHPSSALHLQERIITDSFYNRRQRIRIIKQVVKAVDERLWVASFSRSESWNGPAVGGSMVGGGGPAQGQRRLSGSEGDRNGSGSGGRTGREDKEGMRMDGLGKSRRINLTGGPGAYQGTSSGKPAPRDNPNPSGVLVHRDGGSLVLDEQLRNGKGGSDGEGGARWEEGVRDGIRGKSHFRHALADFAPLSVTCDHAQFPQLSFVRTFKNTKFRTLFGFTDFSVT